MGKQRLSKSCASASNIVISRRTDEYIKQFSSHSPPLQAPLAGRKWMKTSKYGDQRLENSGRRPDKWAIVLDKESCEIVNKAIVHKESWLLSCNCDSHVVVRHPSGNAFPFEFVKAQILAGWKWMKASKKDDQRCENSGYRNPARLHQPVS